MYTSKSVFETQTWIEASEEMINDSINISDDFFYSARDEEGNEIRLSAHDIQMIGINNYTMANECIDHLESCLALEL